MKGQFVAFGGAGGKILAVQDGQVTVGGAGGAEFTVPVVKLGAKQALHYSGLKLKADARSKLMAAVLLLADATALDEAGEALDKAGDGPSVAIYKERLNAQLTAAAEAAAQKAWLRIEEEATGKLDPAKAGRLSKSLADFAKAHRETKFHKGLGEKFTALKTRIEDSLVFTEWPFDEKEAKRRQKATADALGVKIEQDIEIAKGVKMTFVLIPPGEFLMGSPPTKTPEQLVKIYGGTVEEYQREFPQHRVKISRSFWLGKYEVTQEQWQSVTGENPSNSKLKDKPQHPVETVSWQDCQGFLQKLSARLGKTFRLPTEAQWEYACRAGTASEFSFGDRVTDLGYYGWFGGNTASVSHQPVGKTKPNAWGLHDMHGNVCEWCEDWLGPYEKGEQMDPRGAGAGHGRVLRGGSFYDGARYLRSACRNTASDAGPRGSYVGVRVVFVPGPK
jgi:formylglycine-generating enzyme required for sulfatase activity